jgi:hypothetical protein
MSTQRYRSLDVRPLLKRGVEPFSAITTEVDSLQADEGLMLLTPFLPAPLIEHLRNNGFGARPERLPDGSWQTFFSRNDF